MKFVIIETIEFTNTTNVVKIVKSETAAKNYCLRHNRFAIGTKYSYFREA